MLKLVLHLNGDVTGGRYGCFENETLNRRSTLTCSLEQLLDQVRRMRTLERTLILFWTLILFVFVFVSFSFRFVFSVSFFVSLLIGYCLSPQSAILSDFVCLSFF